MSRSGRKITCAGCGSRYPAELIRCQRCKMLKARTEEFWQRHPRVRPDSREGCGWLIIPLLVAIFSFAVFLTENWPT